MERIKIQSVKELSLLVIGLVLLSNGIFGVPQIPYEGPFFIVAAVILFASAVHSLLQERGT
ncbi:hypothetical protein [Natrinema altunense]|uniref:Uncharacterized protein n=1 Tax=Natrinema altunense (strain JCM 12890 / CGMCC 1.3731 / AJ2) TaxID=1227494 RepID=L9ZF61_NATA2|nr:hypothetical protein [Natrinema altunense]ELY84681.1 hypothetical protein C485_15025 [Natrinema altunense JCM 12890]